ncbi:MAG: carboxypeptidase regulatory-like domain-containing protein, partial [Candidatus Thermochlorobacter sp.]
GISTTTFFGRDLVSEQAITYDQNLISTAVTTNSIPEGNYEFCVRILNAAGQAIAEVPCRTFTVLIPDPPAIVSPVDNAELLATAPPTFVWTPVQFVSNVRYNLRIAPLFAGQNRRQAIESNPPLVNQTGIVGTSFFYSPSLPSFNLYAQAVGWVWQVQAVNARGVPVTRNEGRSEIGVFKFKPPVAQNQPRPPTPAAPTPTIPPPASLPFQPTLQPPVTQNTVLKGKIVYSYFGAPNVAPTGERPLKNTPLRLSLYRYAKNFSKNFSGPNTEIYPGEYNKEWNQVGRDDRPTYLKTLATTTTDANGNYTFSFVQTDSTGYRGKQTFYTVSELGSVTSFTFDEYITMRVEVENPYFTSPDNNLMIQPKQLIDLSGSQAGTLVAKVRTFDLTLTVEARNVPEDQGAAFQGQRIPGAKVYVLRETVPTNLPQEGNAAGAPNLGVVLLGKQAGLQTMADDAEKSLYNLKVVSIGETDALGKVTFKLIRNLSPNDNYIIWATLDSTSALSYRFLAQKFTSRGKWSPSGNFVATTPEDEDVKWNNEYPNYSNCQRDMTLFGVPSQPRVSGAVYFSQNMNQPVENAIVELQYFAVLLSATEATQLTGGNGYFNFWNLPTTKGEFGVGQSYPLIRSVRITKPGYKEKIVLVNNGESLKRGQRAWLGKILLEPKATVNGSVVDAETGQGVSATVTFQDGVAVQTSRITSGNVSSNVGIGASLSPGGGFMGVGGMGIGGTPSGMGSNVSVSELFSAKAPRGNNIRVIVKPNNQNYFSPETLFVNISSNTVTLEPFKVYQKKRRIQIRVLEEVSARYQQNLLANKPIAAVKVTITNLPNQPSVITDEQGIARFEPFFNASSTYTIRIETTNAPRFQMSDFLTKEVTYNGVFVESKSYIGRTVFLPRAGRISGRVLVGRARPVAGARVRLVSSGSGLPIETFTDAQGNYTLKKVPLGQGLKFRASKSQSQTVGTDTTLNITGTHTTINFVLREYNDMDITKLWGFPIEVDDLREQGNQVFIDGSFVTIPANSQFKLMDNDSALAFANVPIEPIAGSDNGKGIPFARPKNAQIIITDKNLFRDVRVYNQFLAKVFDPSGLKVVPLENNTSVGAVRGRVYVRRSSFSFSTSSLEFSGSTTSDTAFYLLRPDKSGAERLVIPALTAHAQSAVNAPQGFQIGNGTGSNLKFKLYGFESEADNASSFLLGGSAKLKARLHTAFTNVSPADMNLDIGIVEVKPNGVQPISGTTKIAIPLGTKWTLESSDWSLNTQSGFTLKAGAVKTGGVDIGFTGIKIEPTRLETASSATYNFSNLPVAGGIATMKTLQGSAAQLGYDLGQQKWSFTIGKGTNPHAAFVEGLPNCAPSDQLLFDNITLFSDGKSGFTLKTNHPVLTVHTVATFKPTQANFYENLIQLSGQVDYNIPLLQPITTLLRFEKKGGSTVASIAPAEFEIKPNAVTMKFPNAEGTQTLDATGFTAKGKIYETVAGGNKMFEFQLTLRKTPDGTITATLDEGQTFNFSNGKSQLKNLSGGLKPISSSAWEQFKFAGDIESDDGISGHLAFVVTGD